MKTILVVDDEFDLASTLRAILEGAGYGAQTCFNGQETLDRLGEHRPDLLLMDVMMPLMSGYEVLKVMKATPGLDGIPVVLMSAVPPAVRQKDFHWQAFLLKPFSLDALLRTVGGLIGQGH